MTRSLFYSPPRLKNSVGEIRKVGFEIEFTGLELVNIVALVIKVFGGVQKEINPYHVKVVDSDVGTFSVELDFRFLKEELLKEELQELGMVDEGTLEFIRQIEEVIATLSQTVVPFEIATPPIAIDRLDRLDLLERYLRQSGALGTDASLFYAFGLHVNPEVATFEVHWLLDVLRAFLVLYEWLVYKNRTDTMRRLTPYIKPFEKEYLLLVLDKSYQPTLEVFIDDYLLYNPTRNRPLDLLPLFAYLDKGGVQKRIDDPKVSARPAFHYRLPDSRIDEEEHNIARAWNEWVEVEMLAEDKARLALLCVEYLDYLKDPFSLLEESWAKRVEAWQQR